MTLTKSDDLSSSVIFAEEKELSLPPVHVALCRNV